MFYKKLIILSIFYLSLISYINIIELSNIEDISSNTAQINNNNNNKKKKSINLRNDKKLIAEIKNKIHTTQDNKQLLSLCYSNCIVKSENNTITHLKFNDVIINIEENNLFSLIYNEKTKKLVYTPRLISLLKNNEPNNKCVYQVHKKTFIIPFYIFDFVPINKIPKNKDGYFQIRFDKKLKEICKRKFDYNQHHLDILSYLATHEYELDNFDEIESGDVYTKIDNLFKKFEYKLNNNEYFLFDEIGVKMDVTNVPMIYKGIQMVYYLYKIYNTSVDDKYNKTDINTSKFITLAEKTGYTLVAVPYPDGLTYAFGDCYIDKDSNVIPIEYKLGPDYIFMFYKKYMQDTDLKTILNYEDMKKIVETEKIDSIPKYNDLD